MMCRVLLSALAIAAFAVLGAAPASAQAPARGHLLVSVQHDYGYLGQQVALQGQQLRVKGVVTPYVDGEQVTVRITGAARRPLEVRRTLVKQGNRGIFFVNFTARRAGRIRVSASHVATGTLGSMSASARSVAVIVPGAGSGASGLRVRFLQQRLFTMRYLLKLSGSYDDATQRAVLTFRKVNRMARITSSDARLYTLAARYQGGFRAKHPNHGRHVEADLGRQVIALINPRGRVFKVFMTSSGKSSTPTIVGSYNFYSKDFGTNAKGMVHSNYFVGGYAIHGYPDVPTYPASHGCLRIPIPNARFVFSWITIGERIDVYLRGGRTHY